MKRKSILIFTLLCFACMVLIGASVVSKRVFKSHVYLQGPWYVENTEVTTTATELNLMDGVTATTSELNYIDGGLARTNIVQDDAGTYTIPLGSVLAADGAALGASDTQGSGDHFISYSSGVLKLMGNSPASTTETDTSIVEFSLPPEYVDGETVTVRINGEYTSDGDSKTLDVVAYESTATNATVGSDICDTSVKTLTGTDAAYDFTITPTDLKAGDILVFEVTTVFQDSDGSVGEAEINSIQVLLDVKG